MAHERIIEMIDTIPEHEVEVLIDRTPFGYKLTVNVDGVCRLRAGSITEQRFHIDLSKIDPEDIEVTLRKQQ